MDNAGHAKVWAVVGADIVLDKKKFGGHNRLKKCCIHRRCNSYSENKQSPPTQSEVQDTIKTLTESAAPFRGMFG